MKYLQNLSEAIKEKTGYDVSEIMILIFLMSAFAITMIRAAITQITDDEAFTYLKYCKPAIFRLEGFKDIFNNSIANNHLLNTYLITLFDHFFKHRFNEFIIRLPVLMFFLIYVLSIFALYKKKYIPATVAVFLSSNYYLNEFYGLARGYAMCNTLVLLACASCLIWKKSDYEKDGYMILSSIFIALAVLSNTIVLLSLPSFGFMWLIGLINKKRVLEVLRKYAVYLVVWGSFVGALIKYHMNVTAMKQLYTGAGSSFFECYFVSIGKMFIGRRELALILGCILAISILTLLIWLVYLKKILNCIFFVGIMVFGVTSVLMEFLFGKGYACGRELLPFYALIVFGMWDAVACIRQQSRQNPCLGVCCKYFCAVICMLFVLNYVRQIDISSTREWSWEYSFDGSRDYGRREHIYRDYIIADGEWGKMQIPESESDLFYISKMDDIYINAK